MDIMRHRFGFPKPCNCSSFTEPQIPETHVQNRLEVQVYNGASCDRQFAPRGAYPGSSHCPATDRFHTVMRSLRHSRKGLRKSRITRLEQTAIRRSDAFAPLELKSRKKAPQSRFRAADWKAGASLRVISMQGIQVPRIA